MYPNVPSWEELDALIAVAHAGSISAAARAEGLQQQTLSARIQRAETTLGFTMFERSPYGVSLTDRGHTALVEITNLMEYGRAFNNRMKLLGDATTPRHLTVAVSNTIAEVYFPEWAAAFHERYPSVQVTMLQANSHGVRDLVASGKAAVGFVEGGSNPHQFMASDLGEDTLVVAVPPTHEWQGAQISKEQLRSTPLVVREPGSGTREVVEHTLGKMAVPAGEFGSMASQRAGINALNAPGVIAASAISDAVAMGKLVVVDTPEVCFTRTLQAIRLRQASFNKDAQALVETAREMLAGPSRAG